MNSVLRSHAGTIINASIRAVQPDAAVRRAVSAHTFPGRIILVAAGKAAWHMAKAAYDCLGSRITSGIVLTKYHHVQGPLGPILCCEGGHPVPDESTFANTEKALKLVEGLSPDDTVLFLLSGGGSALFEKPLIPPDMLRKITSSFLHMGADIVEMNTVRKRLSAVKGGRFAQLCAPAHVFSVILSDILGDPLDMIASGPTVPDTATCGDALAIIEKYGIPLPPEVLALFNTETPKSLPNTTTQITGSVRELCAAAASACEALGYETFLLTDHLCCEAREAGSFLASILRTHSGASRPLAFLAGGETVVQVTGTGTGGRNQELALSAATGLDGLPNAAVFSVGSDGTDGPTDAAGGYTDGGTAAALRSKGIDIYRSLLNNDAYHALRAVDGLIITGPTGTNVNDISVALLRP